MKWFKIEEYKTEHILLLVAVVILVAPILLTLPSTSKYFNFSNTGEIGDTIGGITSPFINGIAAVLVFIAFKAQIQANKIFKNQDERRVILEQITLIQVDKLEIENCTRVLMSAVTHLTIAYNEGTMTLINKIIYFTSDIRLVCELIESFEGKKDFLYRKIYYLYVIRYRELLVSLSEKLNEMGNVHTDYKKKINELISEIEYINQRFKDVDKYKNDLN